MTFPQEMVLSRVKKTKIYTTIFLMYKPPSSLSATLGHTDWSSPGHQLIILQRTFCQPAAGQEKVQNKLFVSPLQRLKGLVCIIRILHSYVLYCLYTVRVLATSHPLWVLSRCCCCTFPLHCFGVAIIIH